MGLFEGQPVRYSLADCRAAIARYQFTEHQHPRARDGTFMARGQGRDRGTSADKSPKPNAPQGASSLPKNESGLISQKAYFDQWQEGEGKSVGEWEVMSGKHPGPGPGFGNMLQKEIDSGKKIIFHTDGGDKKVNVVKFANGMAFDDKGARWGGLDLQKGEGFEIVESKPAASQPPQSPVAKPGKGGPEGKIFDAPKSGPEAKVFDPPAAKQTTTDAAAKTEVKPELPPGPGEFGHSQRPNAAPMQSPAPAPPAATSAAPAMSKPPKPGFQERRAKLQERAKKKEAEFEGMTDEERTAHKAERDAKAMVHNARKAKKPAGFIQQLMSHWLGTKNQLGAAKKAAKAKKAAPAPTTQPAATQTPTAAPQADANPFAGFHETNIQDRMWDIAEGRHLRHQADGEPVRYMKDASGHEHDEEGKFTGTGGGSSKESPIVKEKTKPADYEIRQNAKGDYLVYRAGVTASTLVATIGRGLPNALERAKAEIVRRQHQGGGSSKLIDMQKNGHPRDWSEEGIKSLVAGLSTQEVQQVAESIGMKGKVNKKALEARYIDRLGAWKKTDQMKDHPMATERYSAAECRLRLAMSRRRLLPAGVRG